MEPEIPEEMLSMMETFMENVTKTVAPMLRHQIREVLERNDQLVKQDEMSLGFLTEELINAILRGPQAG